MQIQFAIATLTNPRSKFCIAYELRGQKVIGIYTPSTHSNAQMEYDNGPEFEVLQLLTDRYGFRSAGDTEVKNLIVIETLSLPDNQEKQERLDHITAWLISHKAIY